MKLKNWNTKITAKTKTQRKTLCSKMKTFSGRRQESAIWMNLQHD